MPADTDRLAARPAAEEEEVGPLPIGGPARHGGSSSSGLLDRLGVNPPEIRQVQAPTELQKAAGAATRVPADYALQLLPGHSRVLMPISAILVCSSRELPFPGQHGGAVSSGTGGSGWAWFWPWPRLPGRWFSWPRGVRSLDQRRLLRGAKPRGPAVKSAKPAGPQGFPGACRLALVAPSPGSWRAIGHAPSRMPHWS
jgi:hypothetical protein